MPEDQAAADGHESVLFGVFNGANVRFILSGFAAKF